jgi:hypothetical protein
MPAPGTGGVQTSLTAMVQGMILRRQGGIARPSSFAVWRLMMKSNFTGSWMGRSPGLAPFRMRST